MTSLDDDARIPFRRADGALTQNAAPAKRPQPRKTKRRGDAARPIRHFFEYVGLRAIGWIMRVLPIDAATATMGWFWKVIAPRLHRHSRAVEHIAFAFPEKSAAECEAIAVAMWEHLGRVFAEGFMVERLVRAGRVDDHGAALLAELKATGKPIVFASLHAGNWELVVTPTLTAGIGVAGIYQKLKNPIVDEYLVRLRRNRYPRGLFAKGSDIGRKLIRIAKDGGAIAMLADLRDRRGVVVPFFGHPAPSTPFPAMLARTTDAILVAARVVRTHGSHFRITAEIVEVPKTGDREADVLEGTRRIHALFESWIRENPEQWMWAHRRWG